MISIAIDGPAGAGKSTVAKRVAEILQYIYVDTGAMYRTVGLYVHQKGGDPSKREDVLPCLKEIDIQIRYIPGEGQRIYLNSEDVSQAIRQPEISMAASNVSAMAPVREFLFDLQQNTAKTNNVIMDGRDIGTVVLPNAQVKIFLTASLEERSRRRYLELAEKGEQVTLEGVMEDVRQRDYNDSHRPVSPLKQAEDAILVDTTGYDFEQSVQLVLSAIKERLKDVL